MLHISVDGVTLDRYKVAAADKIETGVRYVTVSPNAVIGAVAAGSHVAIDAALGCVLPAHYVVIILRVCLFIALDKDGLHMHVDVQKLYSSLVNKEIARYMYAAAPQAA